MDSTDCLPPLQLSHKSGYSEPYQNPPRSTMFKLWHGLIYFIGCLLFLTASLILYPQLSFDQSLTVSGCFFTAGSLLFLVADVSELTQHNLYLLCSDKPPTYAKGTLLQTIVSIICSALYLVGSTMFIPITLMAHQGYIVILIGSGLGSLSQSWKIKRTYWAHQKSLKTCICEDLKGFGIDFCSLMSHVGFFVGIGFVYEYNRWPANELLNMLALGCFVFGSFVCVVAAILLLWKYYTDK